jgi:predicted anti-sigma-YlaC factor YlaD
VDCTRCREILSDALDGRADAVAGRAADAHVTGCVECRAYRDEIAELQRLVRLRPAEPVPDQTTAILARAPLPAGGRQRWVRYGLLVVGLTQLALALPALLLGEDGDAPAHLARHIGSLAGALAIGLLYAAWRPARAAGLLPIAVALAACTAVTAVADVVDGRASALGEGAHVLELAGLVFLWMLAGSPRPSWYPLPAGRSAAIG